MRTVPASHAAARLVGASRGAAFQAVSLELAYGELVAFLGGAEASTLVDCLTGAKAVTAGEAWIAGVRLDALSARTRARHLHEQVGRVDTALLPPGMTAREILTVPFRLAGRPVDPAHLDRVLDLLDLRHRTGAPAETFAAAGEVGRLALGFALAGDPDLVVADGGVLDRAELVAALGRWAHRWEPAAAFVTDDPDLAALADRAIVVRHGRIVADLDAPTTRELTDILGEAVPHAS
ncbi:MAG: ATP-binding cassette domain-containing protein [Mycobacteriales bacterium]